MRPQGRPGADRDGRDASARAQRRQRALAGPEVSLVREPRRRDVGVGHRRDRAARRAVDRDATRPQQGNGLGDRVSTTMNTRLVMTASAFVMGALGLSATFLPQEIAAWLGASATLPLLIQVLGALYFAFAMLNWTAKDGLIGGI